MSIMSIYLLLGLSIALVLYQALHKDLGSRAWLFVPVTTIFGPLLIFMIACLVVAVAAALIVGIFTIAMLIVWGYTVTYGYPETRAVGYPHPADPPPFA